MFSSPTPNSRSYLTHFTQPDSIIPDPYNSQDWDRYAYALNNPLRYTDPTGHCPVCAGFAIAGAIVAAPFVLSAFGLRPDVEGAMIASAVTVNQDSDVLVTTGIAVQSEYPWGIVGGNAQGWAQATYKELMDGEKDPYSPGAATTIMKDRIYGAINACKLCNNGNNDGVDKLIVAAIAQNGYGLDFKSLPKSDGNIDWGTFFSSNVGSSTSDPYAQLRQTVTGMDYNTEFMVKIFIHDLRYLMSQGYDLPDGIREEDIATVEKLLEDWKRNQKNR
jgi:hypothetical protein